MDKPIRILLVEDVPTDANLARREILQALEACEFELVDSHDTYLVALSNFRPDVIVSDYAMPSFDGMAVLQLAQEHAPLTPVIILTGSLDEDTAVACMKAGAVDYVLKEHLRRLGSAVIQALQTSQLRQERQRARDALRASEELYRTLVRTLPDPLIVADAKATISYVSPLALQLLGYEPGSAMRGRALLEWIDPDDRERADEAIRAVLAGGSFANEEFQLRREDGSTLCCALSASCLTDTQDAAVGLILVARDITERKQAAEARAKLEEQLRQAQKMESIGRLAGGVAHDFNNLLTVIEGYTDLMLERLAQTDPLRDDLAQIRRASERATSLTRQLLAFSRKQMLAPTTLDLNSLVTNMHQMLERVIGEDVLLRIDLQPGLWHVTADPNQIEQVILNLSVNARDAMPTGGSLTIETRNMFLN
ncbi:MAG TPA: PAS domain S-box protein, partial [Roseiflexaceae bacterium]|nr:PAS domain S-box protein [Roseiflexaceae bacterium]